MAKQADPLGHFKDSTVATQLRALGPEGAAEVQLVAEKIAIQLRYNNRSAAHDLVDLYLEQQGRKGRETEFEDTPVAEVLETRIANALVNCIGVNTIGDLLNTEINELLAVPNFSYHSVIHCYAQLLRHTIKQLKLLQQQLLTQGIVR